MIMLFSQSMEILFVLRLHVPVNNFSVMSGQSHRFLGITCTFGGVECLAQGHNMAEIDFESPTFHSTTEPPAPLKYGNMVYLF